MISQAHVWLCDPLSHPNYDINCFYCEIVETQLNYLTLADKDQLSTPSRFGNSSRSMWDMTLPALFVSLLSLASLLRSSFQGHQELSGKSDKNNSLKPNQTTPSEHCHFQRLRAKPNFLRLSRTERDLNTRLNFDECALIWRKPKSDMRICWLLQIYSHK